MPKQLANVAGVTLYTDGIEYEIKNGGIRHPNQNGFSPLMHVNSAEVAEVRSIFNLLFRILLSVIAIAGLNFEATMRQSLYFYPTVGLPIYVNVILGLLGLALIVHWYLNPKTVLLIQSEGNSFITAKLDKSLRPQALLLVDKYRQLKYKQLHAMTR